MLARRPAGRSGSARAGSSSPSTATADADRDRVAVPSCRGPRPSLRRGRRRAPRRAWVAAARPPRLGPGRGRVRARGASSCARRFATRSPSSGEPTATAPRHVAGRDRRALPHRAPRGRPRPGGGRRRPRRPRGVADLPRRVRAGRALVRLSQRPGGLGEQELQHPSTNMWVWQRCRAAPKPSGTTHSWPSCSAGSRTYNPNADAALIRAAFDYSCLHHQRSAAKERRGVHPPSGCRCDDLRRAEARRGDDRRGAAS